MDVLLIGGPPPRVSARVKVGRLAERGAVGKGEDVAWDEGVFTLHTPPKWLISTETGVTS
jgi:hypothetical protein